MSTIKFDGNSVPVHKKYSFEKIHWNIISKEVTIIFPHPLIFAFLNHPTRTCGIVVG
jgi:hypothetical protein